MKITGVAPKIAVITFSYIALTIVIHYLTYPLFIISDSGYAILLTAGIILLAAGILIVGTSGMKILKSFNKNILVTDGLFHIVRNPMYAAYLIFILPGISLLFNSWLVFTSVIINFAVFEIFIKEEYKFLADKYGEEYNEYLKNVWFKFL